MNAPMRPVTVPVWGLVSLGLLLVALWACGTGDSMSETEAILVGSDEATGVTCDTNRVVVGFWPDGHGKIPSINAPDTPTPHVEVGVVRFGLDMEVGYFDLLGDQRPGNAGRTELKADPVSMQLTDPGFVSESAVLGCDVPDGVDVWSTNRGLTPTVIELVSGTKLVAVVHLENPDSTLHFDQEACRRGPAPSS